jgi:hypothetical protein
MNTKRGLNLSLDDETDTPSRSIERPSMRTEIREKSALELARERAAQIRGAIGDDDGEWQDKFWTPEPPEGWSYEWKAIKVFNKVDENKLREVRRTGWTEVPRERHPEMTPFNTDLTYVEREGQILMERPAEITEEFRRRAQKDARQAIENKKKQLGQDSKGVAPKISNKYEPMAIPD